MHRKIARAISVFIFLSSVSGISDGAVSRAKRKTMTRSYDYVTVRGNELKSNLNKKIKSFSLLALNRGRLMPVPFQIDELTPQEDWVLTRVPPSIDNDDLQPENDVDKGCLDNNDELVFMLRDSGDKLKEKDYPESAIAVDEIELIDPISGGVSWVYLCSYKALPPLTRRDYVKYKFPEDHIITDNYTMGFSRELPIAPDYVRVHGCKDLLDRMKLRLDMKIFFIPYSLYEEDFVSDLSLYNDGPVRVVRRTTNSIKVMGVFQTPSAAIEGVFYDNIIIIPFRIRVPINLKDFKSVFSAKMRAGVDFCNIHGWKFKTDNNKEWYEIDGKMSKAEEQLNGQSLKWFVLSGEIKKRRVGLLVNMVFNRKRDGSFQETPFKPTLYYVDNDDKPDPPEFVPGQSPNVNYWMNGFCDISEGILYFYAIVYILDDYKDGMEQGYLQILDKPVRVTVN